MLLILTILLSKLQNVKGLKTKLQSTLKNSRIIYMIWITIIIFLQKHGYTVM